MSSDLNWLRYRMSSAADSATACPSQEMGRSLSSPGSSSDPGPFGLSTFSVRRSTPSDHPLMPSLPM
ncbi:hypothetical protein ACFPRL_30485 [Pseudoclavibacter helvolus]